MPSRRRLFVDAPRGSPSAPFNVTGSRVEGEHIEVASKPDGVAKIVTYMIEKEAEQEQIDGFKLGLSVRTQKLLTQPQVRSIDLHTRVSDEGGALRFVEVINFDSREAYDEFEKWLAAESTSSALPEFVSTATALTTIERFYRIHMKQTSTLMLCCWANPRDKTLPTLSLNREAQFILQLQQSCEPGAIRLIMETTPENLREHIEQWKPSILCISGHTIPSIAGRSSMPLYYDTFKAGAEWSREPDPPTAFPRAPRVSQDTSELIQFLNDCLEHRSGSPTGTCRLDRDFVCDTSVGCRFSIQGNTVRVRDSHDTFKSESQMREYAGAIALENGWGRLSAIPPAEFEQFIGDAYARNDESKYPRLIFLNMCSSHLLGERLYNYFAKKRQPTSVICWSTVAEDLSALQFFKTLISGMRSYFEGAAPLTPELISRAFDDAFDVYTQHHRIGNPLKAPVPSSVPMGIPLKFIGKTSDEARPSAGTPPSTKTPRPLNVPSTR